ncbi:DUF192 domain-containing protein [Halotia wernerae UHCC 0503]|nr:DUF192 domain-containing protein [Halotia wernerae UHCC 0503]
MMRWLSLLPMLLGILLMGCSMQTTAKSPTSTPSATSQTATPTGQTLPISAKATVPNGTTIELEVAKTQEQQEKGLMYRPALPANRGMLFKFPSPQPVKFWMKNVPVPLDMVFLQNGVVEYVETSAPPCAGEPCPTYGPNVAVDTVLELRSGRAAELNLQQGDRVKIEF